METANLLKNFVGVISRSLARIFIYQCKEILLLNICLSLYVFPNCNCRVKQMLYLGGMKVWASEVCWRFLWADVCDKSVRRVGNLPKSYWAWNFNTALLTHFGSIDSKLCNTNSIIMLDEYNSDLRLIELIAKQAYKF